LPTEKSQILGGEGGGAKGKLKKRKGVKEKTREKHKKRSAPLISGGN